MALLMMAVACGRSVTELPHRTELFFRLTSDGQIELITDGRHSIGWVPPLWLAKIRATERHKVAPTAWLWASAVVDGAPRALIVVATAGSNPDNADRNPALQAEAERLMAPSAAPEQAGGAWGIAGLSNHAEASRAAVDTPKLYPAGIVGEQHYQPAVRRCRSGHMVRLIHEPSNPYDRRAVMVQSAGGECIGYLPRESWMHGVMLDEGQEVSARIKAIEDRGEGFLQVVLDVVVGSPSQLVMAIESGWEDEEDIPQAGRVSIPVPLIALACLGLILFLGFCTGGIR